MPIGKNQAFRTSAIAPTSSLSHYRSFAPVVAFGGAPILCPDYPCCPLYFPFQPGLPSGQLVVLLHKTTSTIPYILSLSLLSVTLPLPTWTPLRTTCSFATQNYLHNSLQFISGTAVRFPNLSIDFFLYDDKFTI